MAFSGLRFRFFGHYPQNLQRKTTDRLVRKLKQRAQLESAQETNELEMNMLLSPDEDAPDAPTLFSNRQKRAAVILVVGVVFVVIYGSGMLHM